MFTKCRTITNVSQELNTALNVKRWKYVKPSFISVLCKSMEEGRYGGGRVYRNAPNLTRWSSATFMKITIPKEAATLTVSF